MNFLFSNFDMFILTIFYVHVFKHKNNKIINFIIFYTNN